MKYTKRQIKEAISYWTKRLRKLDEDVAGMTRQALDKKYNNGWKFTPEYGHRPHGFNDIRTKDEFEKDNNTTFTFRETKTLKNGLEMKVYTYPDAGGYAYYAKTIELPPDADVDKMKECLVEVLTGWYDKSTNDGYMAERNAIKFIQNMDGATAEKFLKYLAGKEIVINTIATTIWRLLQIGSKVSKGRKNQAAWKQNTLAGIEAKQKWPDGYTMNSEIELDDFMSDMDLIANNGDSLYNEYVPEKSEEIEGTQRDVDDFDVYKVWLPDTIDEDTFYDQLLEKLSDEFEDGSTIPLDELSKRVNGICDDIAQDALESYEPNEEQLTHRGRMHWGGYYPG